MGTLTSEGRYWQETRYKMRCEMMKAAPVQILRWDDCGAVMTIEPETIPMKCRVNREPF